MYNDLDAGLDSFYDKTEIEKQKILAKILDYANSAPNEFITVVQSEGFNEPNHLPIFYEALSKDLTKWADFFLSEINRLFEIAKTGSEPNKVLTYLNELSFIKPQNFKHRDMFVKILRQELDTHIPIFRYYAINLLTDFVRKDDYSTINKVREYLKDFNWRIRYVSFLFLKDLEKLESYEKLSWTDKLRVNFMNPTKFE